MIYWAQLFHFYQPPTQMPAVLEKICNESYRPLLDVFRQNPHAKATVNINGVLLELLHDCGHRDIIAGFKELKEKGQIEFTGSGKYHPILPLLPQAERKRQIDLNTRTLKQFLGNDVQPAGFFPPEMCYSRDIVPEVIGSGHRWLILSGIACPAEWPTRKVYQIEHDGKRMGVLFRDDVLSNKISFRQITAEDFLGHLKQTGSQNGDVYVVTAMDAETYGHHIQDWEKLFLAEVYSQLDATPEPYAQIKEAAPLARQQSVLFQDTQFADQVRTVTISELVQTFPSTEIVDPKPSSWSTSGDDLAAGVAFPLWLDPGNEIHRLQWEHLNLCIEMTNKANECAESDECRFFGTIARALLDIAEHSCQFWWASRRPMWDVNLIHLGLIDQWRVVVNAYVAINKSASVDAETKKNFYHKLVAARDVRNKITDRLFL